MVLFPALVVLVSVVCAVIIGGDWVRRPRPEKAAWLIAFALFAVAAAAEVAGALTGWTPLLARLYYTTGAILVVGFLGLGELYLLAPGRMVQAGPGIGLFLLAVAVALVSGAPVDEARLAADGWHALSRGPALVIFTIAVNSLGTLIVAGGAIFTAWQFWRRGIFRHRMIGCLLIAVGTLIVALGGTLTRLGRPELLYIAMAVGILVIGAGYLETRRRDAGASVRDAIVPAAGALDAAGAAGGAVDAGEPEADSPAPVPGGDARVVDVTEEAVRFVSDLLRLDAAATAERCAFWSAPAVAGAHFTREQARRVWCLRLALGVAARPRLDALPAATQVQLADLYFDVLLAESPALEVSRPAPILIGAVAAPGERTGN